MLPVDEQWIKSEFVRTESERADGVDGWPIKERTAGSVTKFDSSTARGSISWKRCSWGLNGSVAGGAFREPAVGAFRSAGDPLIFETPITDLNTTERLGHLQNRRAKGLPNLGGTVLTCYCTNVKNYFFIIEKKVLSFFGPTQIFESSRFTGQKSLEKRPLEKIAYENLFH